LRGAPAERGGELVITRNLKKRKVPKADGRYLIYYERV